MHFKVGCKTSREEKHFFMETDDFSLDRQAFRHARCDEEAAPPTSLLLLALVVDVARCGSPFLCR